MTTRLRSSRLLTWTAVALTAAAAAIAARSLAAQQASPGEPTSTRSAPATLKQVAPEAPAETPAPEASREKKIRVRLPNYYGRVVDSEQREKIYAIQREYAPKIEALEAQLAALKAERDERVEGVLTAEQLAKVREFRAEAKAKRARARAAKAAAE